MTTQLARTRKVVLLIVVAVCAMPAWGGDLPPQAPPTVPLLDALGLADAAYGGKRPIPAGWAAIHSEDRQNGLKFTIFRRGSDGQIALSFAGTRSPFGGGVRFLNDVVTNLFSSSGLSTFSPGTSQYLEAYSITADLQEVMRQAGIKSPLVVVGHSKGGGIAQFVGALTRSPTYAFNSAPLGSWLVGLIPKARVDWANRGGVRRYDFATDPVHKIAILPASSHLGTQTVYHEPSFFWRIVAPWSPIGAVVGGIGAHSLEPMKKQIQAHQRSTEITQHDSRKRALSDAESLARLRSLARTTRSQWSSREMDIQQVFSSLGPSRAGDSFMCEVRSSFLAKAFEALGKIKGSAGWTAALSGVVCGHFDYAVTDDEIRRAFAKRSLREHVQIGGLKVINAAIKHDPDFLDKRITKRWPAIRPGLVGGAIAIGGHLQSGLATMSDTSIWIDKARAHPTDPSVGVEGISVLLKVAACLGLPYAVPAATVLDKANAVGQEIRSSVLQQRVLSMVDLPSSSQARGALHIDQQVGRWNGRFTIRGADGKVFSEGGWTLEHPGDRNWHFGRMFQPNSHYAGWVRTPRNTHRMADGSVFTGTTGRTWIQTEDANGVRYERTRTVNGTIVVHQNGARMNRDIQRAMAAEAKGERWIRDSRIGLVTSPKVSESGQSLGDLSGVSMKIDLPPSSFTTDRTGRLRARREQVLQNRRSDKKKN